jgi:hypothetical protein
LIVPVWRAWSGFCPDAGWQNLHVLLLRLDLGAMDRDGGNLFRSGIAASLGRCLALEPVHDLAMKL